MNAPSFFGPFNTCLIVVINRGLRVERLEVFLIQTLQRITLLAGWLDSNVMFDHQFCKLFTVD